MTVGSTPNPRKWAIRSRVTWTLRAAQERTGQGTRSTLRTPVRSREVREMREITGVITVTARIRVRVRYEEVITRTRNTLEETRAEMQRILMDMIEIGDRDMMEMRGGEVMVRRED